MISDEGKITGDPTWEAVERLLTFMRKAVDKVAPDRSGFSIFHYKLTYESRFVCVEIHKRHSNNMSYRSRYFWVDGKMGDRISRAYAAERIESFINYRCDGVGAQGPELRKNFIKSIDDFIADSSKEYS